MNGPTLRIGRTNKNGSNVSKKASYFTPIKLEIASQNGKFSTFVNAKTVEIQLTCMKEIIQAYEETPATDAIDFLAQVFLEAPPKHPVKCFLARHVTRSTSLQKPFADSLSKYLLGYTTNEHSSYCNYTGEVSKLMACIENFPAGVAAFKLVEMELARYLMNCANTCILSLSSSYTDLSVTKKNEVLELAHLTLRLLLYVVQKLTQSNDGSARLNQSEDSSVNLDQSENDCAKINQSEGGKPKVKYALENGITNLNQPESGCAKLNSISKDLMIVIKQLLVDEDLPMDAKSVAGILLLTMYIKQNDATDWTKILCERNENRNIIELMNIPLVRLSLYAAIVNVVPVNELEIFTVTYNKEKTSAIIALASRLIDMTNQYATESVIVLGVSRTLLQLSKMLHKLTRDSGALFAHLWPYVQEHLNHHMDSVQHLSSQTLDSLVVFAVSQKKKGNLSPLTALICDTNKMPWTTKAPFVSLIALSKQTNVDGSMLISSLLKQLPAQATQASVTTLLEILLKKHCQKSSAEKIDSTWIEPIIWNIAHLYTYDTNTISIINNLIAKAVDIQPELMQILLERIKQLIKSTPEENTTSYVMALLNVVKKAGGVLCVADEMEGYWKGLVKYELLERSAVDIDDKARHLSLSLIVESPKTTEVFTRDELQFVLFYLKYNINEQSPHFRQLTLSLLKKFMKRLMTSYTVLQRQTVTNPEDNKSQFYLDFVNELREFCLDGLFEGANYSRRCIALQLLVWCDHFKLDGYQSDWKEKHVERLLLRLEDTYETNKKFALEILNGCPRDLFKLNNYSISLDLKDIFEQASLLKPTECVSASYKLILVKRKLPESIQELYEACAKDVPELETYILIQALLNIEASQFASWNNGLGASSSPLYGIFRCIRALLADVDYNLIRSSIEWRGLFLSLIRHCQSATTLVSAVVNDSSPEGYLPMDFTQCNTGDTPVTAQMVLLSAWRTVKECSLLLGEIFTNCSERDTNNPDGALALTDFYDASRYFMSLLEQTQHRGAFEQAYIGFTMLLRRMWQSKNIELCSEPRALLDLVLRQIRGSESSENMDQLGTLGKSGDIKQSGDEKQNKNVEKSGDVERSGDNEQSRVIKRSAAGDSAQPTRRSAGLPLIVQAILMTELEVDANSPHIQTVFDELISMVQSSPEVSSRVHAMNVLRALYRSTALATRAAAGAGRGAGLALERFKSEHWAERNSATLLFSSLMVRMFGVQRERERICVRNRMTGRIFFLKYPMLYNTLLEHLKEACENEDVSSLRPSLFPALLLLSRLYPSSLEGTASHYKLSTLVPLVQRCALASSERVRRAAAVALHALRPPHTSLQTNIFELLDLLQDPKIKRNHCHGILLQLNELLADTRKEKFLIFDTTQVSFLMGKLDTSQWILEQLNGEKPCYIIADEYFKALFRFIEIDDYLGKGAIRIHTYSREWPRKRLRQILANKTSPIFAGRHICLSNAVHNYLRVYQDIDDWSEYVEFIEMCLRHSEYDVVLSALNYLLESFENKKFTLSFKEFPTFTESLKDVYSHSKYPLCVKLSLQVLIYVAKATFIVEMVTGMQYPDNETFTAKLIELIRNEDKPDIYLECLFDYLHGFDTRELFTGSMYDIAGVLFEYSTADNDTKTRLLVAKCLEIHGVKLITICAELGPQRDEYFIYLWCSYIVLLLDEDILIRESICRAYTNFTDPRQPVMVSTKTMELLLPQILLNNDDDDDFNLLVLTVVALLDFKSEVHMNDEDSDEGRVFDQSERHNIFAEEMIITNWAAEKIREMSIYPTMEEKLQVLNQPYYLQIITKMCNDHFVQFKSTISRKGVHKNVNSKVNAFYMIIK